MLILFIVKILCFFWDLHQKLQTYFLLQDWSFDECFNFIQYGRIIDPLSHKNVFSLKTMMCLTRWRNDFSVCKKSDFWIKFLNSKSFDGEQLLISFSLIHIKRNVFWLCIFNWYKIWYKMDIAWNRILCCYEWQLQTNYVLTHYKHQF